MNTGPPATIVLFFCLHLLIISCALSFCTIIALINIRSAHSMSSSLSVSMFVSTSFLFHSFGSIDATVSSPSGGNAAFFEMNCSTCLKLQKVSGYCG